MNLHIAADTHAPGPARISVTIPTNVYFLSGVRNFTVDIVKNIGGFDERWTQRLQTVVDELTNNAIEHGSGEHGNVTLTFTIERQQWIEISVADNGSGPTHHTAAELQAKSEIAKQPLTEASLALRGRGLRIITGWTDSCTFQDNADGGVTATIRKTYEEPTFTPQPITQVTVPEERAGVYILEV